jgi:hypothetical protein
LYLGFITVKLAGKEKLAEKNKKTSQMKRSAGQPPNKSFGLYPLPGFFNRVMMSRAYSSEGHATVFQSTNRIHSILSPSVVNSKHSPPR